MTDKAYHWWKAQHSKYTTFEIAESLYRVSSDYRIKYDWKTDKQVQNLAEVLRYMKEDAKDNESAMMFYDVLYNIARRYKEKKIW